MEHYFSNNPTSKSEERTLTYKLKDKEFKFISDNGVFSKDHVDYATNILLNTLIEEKIEGKLLDIGCGYGVIGITLTKLFNTETTMIDINERALELSKRNAKLNNIEKINIFESNGYENVKDEYNIIITNPPIHAGKETLYKIYEESKNHLINGGSLYIVINKKHGAPSTIKYLTEIFGNCEILNKKSGFNVIKCTKK